MSQPPARTGHGRVRSLRPKLTSTLSEEAGGGDRPRVRTGAMAKPTTAGAPWNNDTQTKVHPPTPPTPRGMESLQQYTLERRESGEEKRSAPAPHAGFQRPVDIVASARGELQKASGAHRSRMNTQYSATSPSAASPSSRFHLPAGSSPAASLLPRPPAAPAVFVPTITLAVSDQAMEALADQQLRASGLGTLDNSKSALPGYSAFAYPSPAQRDRQLRQDQLRRQQQQQQQHPMRAGFSPVPPAQPFAGSPSPQQNRHVAYRPTAVGALAIGAPIESLLRVLTHAQQRAISEAGGAFVVDLLSGLVSQGRTFANGVDGLVVALRQARLQEETASLPQPVHVDSALADRLFAWLAGDECTLFTPRLHLELADLAPLVRAGGLSIEGILRQLQAQRFTCHHPSQLAAACGATYLRALSHVLVMQPLLLPGLFSIDPASGTYLSPEVGWRQATEWMEHGTNELASTSSSSSPQQPSFDAPSVPLNGVAFVSALQTFVDARRTFPSCAALIQAVALGAAVQESLKGTGMEDNLVASTATYALGPSAFSSSAGMYKSASSSSIRNPPASSATALSPSKGSVMQSLLDFFASRGDADSTVGGGRDFLPSELLAERNPVAEVKELLKETACAHDPSLLLFLLSYLHRTLSTVTPSGSPPARTPYFRSWSHLARAIQRVRASEAALKQFFLAEAAQRLVTQPTTGGGGGGRKTRWSELEICQLNTLVTDGIVRPPPGSPAAIEQDREEGAARRVPGEQQLGSAVLQSSASATSLATASQAKASHPLLPILAGFLSAHTTFPSFRELLQAAQDSVDLAQSERQTAIGTLHEVLLNSRDVLLHSSTVVTRGDTEQLLELSGGSMDRAIDRLDQLLPTQPRFRTLGQLGQRFADLNHTAAQERQALYHTLHSPTCTLFAQRGGGAAAYTEVSHATIDQLLALVGPTGSDVQAFLATLVQTKTKLKSVSSLLAMAQEHCDIHRTIREKRERVSSGLRSEMREWLKRHWSLLGQTHWRAEDEDERSSYLALDAHARKQAQLAYASRILGELSSDDLDAFLSCAGVKLGSTTRCAPEDAASLESLFVVLEHLAYLGRTYSNLLEYTADGATDEDGNEIGGGGELISDILVQREVLKAEKRSALRWLQSDESGIWTSASGVASPSSSAAAALHSTATHPPATVFLLPQAITARMTLADMDALFVPATDPSRSEQLTPASKDASAEPAESSAESPSLGSSPTSATLVGAGMHTARVLREITIQRLVSHWHTGGVTPTPHESVDELSTEIQAYYATIFLPLRHAMHTSLLDALGSSGADGQEDVAGDRRASGSVLLPHEFIPSIGDLDSLLDECVWRKAWQWAKDGACQYVATSSTVHAQFLHAAGLRTAATASQSTFLPLVSTLFHSLVQTLGLLEESGAVSCDDIGELIDEVHAFEAEQRNAVSSFLQRHASDIFDSTATLANGRYAIRWAASSSASLLGVLVGNYAGQAFLFERMWEREMAKQRVAAEKHRAAQERVVKKTYHSAHHQQQTTYHLAGSGAPSVSMLPPLPKKHASLAALLAYLDVLSNRRAHLLRTVREKVADSDLLPPSVGATQVGEPEAQWLLAYIEFVEPEERQLDVVAIMLLTLGARADEADQQIRQHNRQLSAVDPSDSASVDHRVVAPPPAFDSPTELLQAASDLVTRELDEVRDFWAADSASSVGSTLLSLALQSHLAADPDACRLLWVACSGSVDMMKAYVRAYIRDDEQQGRGSSAAALSAAVAAFDDLLALSEFLARCDHEAIERSFDFRDALLQRGILCGPGSSTSAAHQPALLSARLQPNRLALQRMQDLAADLGHIEMEHTLAWLHERVHQERGGQAYSSIQILLDDLRDQVDYARAERERAAAAEVVRLAALEEARRVERERLEAEEQARQAEWRRLEEQRRVEEAEREMVRGELRAYLLAPERTLFASIGVSAMGVADLRAEVSAPVPSAADSSTSGSFSSHDRPHLLDALLDCCHGDLPICFRSLSGLEAQSRSFLERDDLLAAVRRCREAFEVDAAELVTWLRASAAEETERILPRYIIDQLREEKEGAEWMHEFDQHAQVGVGQVQQLIVQTVDKALALRVAAGAGEDGVPDDLPASPAFSSSTSLLAAMRSFRAGELASLHAWLESPSAVTLFIEATGDDAQEMSATEGELQRLLLAAPTWPRVLTCLHVFQSQSRVFPSLAALTAAVRSEDEVQQLLLSGVVSFLERESGLLEVVPLTSAQEAMVLERARTLEGSAWRMVNELISVQQMREATMEAPEPAAPGAGEADGTATDGLAGPSSRIGAPFSQLVADLDARRADALSSLRESMASKAGRQAFPAGGALQQHEYECLLVASVDPSCLDAFLDLSPSPTHEFDLFLLAVRRFAHDAWLTHQQVQTSCREYGVLACVGGSSQSRLLSFFDTSFLLSLVRLPSLLVALSSSRHAHRAYPTVESLMNAMSEEAAQPATSESTTIEAT